MKKLFALLTVFISVTTFGHHQWTTAETPSPQVITQWTFFGDVDTPSTGSGTISNIGGVTNVFQAGNGAGTRGYQTLNYPAQGTASGTAGIMLAVSTQGYENIELNFDHRASGTASRFARLDYSLDGGQSWVNNFWNNNGGLAPHDIFYTFTVDFSSVVGVNNNPNFVVRLVSVFSPVAFNQNATLSYGPNEAYMRANVQATFPPDPGIGTGNYGTAGTWRFTNITFSGNVTNGGPVDPTASLSTSTNSLSGFTYVEGQGPSASQSLTISAENLTPVSGNVSVNASANFEVSSDNSNFSQSIQIAYTDGELESTTVYVRLVSGLSVDTFSGSLTISAADATDANVSLSGSVTAPAAPFTLPFVNGLRNQVDLDNALAVGFTLNESVINTGAGGYLQLLNIGTSHFTSPIVFDNTLTTSGFASIAFSLATFGTGNNREVQLQRVDAMGNVLEVLESYFPTSSTYTNHGYVLDLTNVTQPFGLRVAFTAGTAGSIRFRDLSIHEVLIPEISAADCNTTVSGLFTESISADEIPNATSWRFRIFDGVNTLTTSDLPSNSFVFGDFGTSNLSLGTTYQVSASAFANGAWSPFGPSCPVTLAAIPTTSLEFLCDQTMTSIGTRVIAYAMPGVNLYRFSIKNTTTDEEVIVDTNRRFFFIFEQSNFAFNTTYEVKVRVRVGQEFGEWGDVCLLTTPATVQTTNLRPEFCNISIPVIGSNLYATPVTNASAFRFKVSIGATVVEEVVTPGMLFRLSDLTSPQLGVTYSIEVAAQVNGIWGDYGAACTVATPSNVPLTSLRTAFCNVTLPSPNANVFANFVAASDAFRFRVTNVETNEISVTTNEGSGSMRFVLALAPNFSLDNTVYSIEVAARVGGVWGEYGPACTVTIPSSQAMARMASIAEMTAFPNPFNTEFTIKLPTQDTALITVFDMNGRVVNEHSVNQTSEVTLGRSLTTGVYIVQVEQGEETQVFKMVKK